MDEIFEEINRLCSWDCFITSYDGWKLVISTGRSYYSARPFLEFLDVNYLSCPTEFSHPKFRLASSTERTAIGDLVYLEETDLVIAVEAETMANLSMHIFFFVTESISIL